MASGSTSGTSEAWPPWPQGSDHHTVDAGIQYKDWCYQPKVSDPKEVKMFCESVPASCVKHSISCFDMVIQGRLPLDLYPVRGSIIVDFVRKGLILSSDMVDLLKRSSDVQAFTNVISGSQLRYIVLNPGHTEGLLGKGTVVMFSYQLTHPVKVYLNFTDVGTAVMAVNALRRLIYQSAGNDNLKLRTLQPYIICQVAAAFARVQMHHLHLILDEDLLQQNAIGNPAAMRLKLEYMHLVLDEQMLALYSDKFDSTPVFYLDFSRSSTRCLSKVEFVQGELVIEVNGMQVLMSPAMDGAVPKMAMDKIAYLLMYIIKCKDTDIFSEQQGASTNPVRAYAANTIGWEKEVTDLLKTDVNLPGITMLDWRIARVMPRPCTSRSDVRQPPITEYFPPSAESWQSLVSQCQSQPPESESVADAGPSRPDAGGDNDLTDIFLWPQDVAKCSDEMQIMWVAAEADMNDIIQDGLVPSSSIKSGGLDENSAKHFEQCVDEIQEALLNQRYDQALSHIQGMQQIFRDSKVQNLKAVAAMEELHIAKCIYFAVHNTPYFASGN